MTMTDVDTTTTDFDAEADGLFAGASENVGDPTTLYMRPEIEDKLADLYARFDNTTLTTAVGNDDIAVRIVADESDDPEATNNVIVLRKENAQDILIPASRSSLEQLGVWVGLPPKTLFHDRWDADLRQHVLNHLLNTNPGVAAITYSTDGGDATGITRILPPDKQVVDPRHIVGIASSIMGEDAVVPSFVNTPDLFQFEAFSPTVESGDPAVNDLTRHGLRFGQDIKHNLAPWVQSYLYRLICTNGMEVPDESVKVDARGLSVEEVMDELELQARIAFAANERAIQAHYDLRSTPVPNPERVLLRIDNEHSLGRPLRHIVEAAAAIEEPTMFDVVNLITNHANAPGVRNRLNIRRRLETVGGAVVMEHAARCPQCMTALTN